MAHAPVASSLCQSSSRSVLLGHVRVLGQAQETHSVHELGGSAGGFCEGLPRMLPQACSRYTTGESSRVQTANGSGLRNLLRHTQVLYARPMQRLFSHFASQLARSSPCLALPASLLALYWRLWTVRSHSLFLLQIGSGISVLHVGSWNTDRRDQAKRQSALVTK